MSRRSDNDDYFGLPHPWGKVVVGAAVVGAVYAGVAYFQKDRDVADSIDRFGSNVKSDAKGLSTRSRLQVIGMPYRPVRHLGSLSFC
ncbi:hypothetical protein WJX77_010888 [Trebouxia sp. C0004]